MDNIEYNKELDSKLHIAIKMFSRGYNCAQAVLYAFCEDVGIDRNTALKLASGFGGGMGRAGEVCGAITGGILVLGLKYGRGEGQSEWKTEFTYEKTSDLMNKFTEIHGTVICRELLGVENLEFKKAQKRLMWYGLYKKVCIPAVKTVVEVIERLLRQQNSLENWSTK